MTFQMESLLNSKQNINITHTFMHDLNEFITFNGVIYTHFIETWWNISGYNFCHWKGNTEIQEWFLPLNMLSNN